MLSYHHPLLLISLFSSLSYATLYDTDGTHRHHKSPQEFEHGALDHEKEIIEGLEDVVDLIEHRPFDSPVYSHPQGGDESDRHASELYYGANLRKRGKHEDHPWGKHFP